ncbi:hypothetical protein RND81_04G085700 [Saponaria officinalis]|uniref:Pectinesterase inhibitor domain-containing protein n=1 Tax=Saponaria officinalis TaxID=3572 RepID=A0AAW1LM95_SAPOF
MAFLINYLYHHYYFIITLTIFLHISTTISWDPYNPPPTVKALCDKNGNYKWCIDSLNNGGTMEADMHFLAVFARDLGEGNSTWGIDYLNKTVIPNEEDPYVHEVMLTCMDAFSKVKDLLVNKLDNYIFFRKYQQAKPWGIYTLAVMNSCEVTCTAKPEIKCPLLLDIYRTKNTLQLMNNAIELITQGVF